MTECSNCGAAIQSDATFCGQCGADPNVPKLSSTPVSPEPVVSQPPDETTPTSPPPPTSSPAYTRVQVQTASLLHLQTNTSLEIPPGLSVVHLGKPNDRIPPDIDLSGFPDSDVVSRVHADIRLEGDTYYIEDVDSANGTYINHTPLLPGNRHRLRSGDRLALGKGDLMTFIFQLS